MQKNSNKFKLLSISSDLRNAGNATVNENHDQAKAFLDHAKSLNSQLGSPILFVDIVDDSVPGDKVDRMKKADKLMTWANILER